METLLRSSHSRLETRPNQNVRVLTLSSAPCRLCKSSALRFSVYWLLFRAEEGNVIISLIRKSGEWWKKSHTEWSAVILISLHLKACLH